MAEGQSDKEPFYITTAISYVNGPPHLGHAYEAISTDVIARFKRLDGYDVMFLTGTDEHGQKVEKTARASGKEPKAFSDEIASLFKEMVTELNISNDQFIRTTEPRHYEASQGIWRKLEENGDIYLGKYEGWYSIRDEAFYDESELTKDEDGQFRAPTGTEVDWVEEESYFFKLSAYQDKLLAHYEANPDFIRPDFRRNEVASFVRQGLRDLSVSRTNFDWGVPVPGNPDHVMYVWLDALTNYITAVGYPDESNPLYQRYWPADVHIIGKDIVRFHAIYWPAFLMSAGVPLPKCVFGHGFLTIGGEKMSKSLGNVVTSQSLIDEFGLDQVRYFLIREVPFGNDGTISREAINHRIDGDLANDIGNLAQRVLAMINRHCNGEVPQPSEFLQDDDLLLSAARELLPLMQYEMGNLALHKVLEVIWRVVSDANRYVDRQAPWVLRKTDETRMKTVLYVCADVLRQLAICIQPVMPKSAMMLLDQLAVSEGARAFADLQVRLVPGAKLPTPEPIFPSKALRFERSVNASLNEGLAPFKVDRIYRHLRLRPDDKNTSPELDFLIVSDDLVFVIEVKVARRPHEIMNAAQQLKLWINWAKTSREVQEINEAREIVPLIIVPYDTSFSGAIQGVPVLKFNMLRHEYEKTERFIYEVRQYLQFGTEENPR